ncbi:DUF4440 domain-containing protein [Xenorhabdus sp. Sc-CR9]|uniref:DUF4440 domain-containing protein n=1 Tax=Xenorhabdus sp. Sc-CR9 TaxID=2584468 RepID=UPI003FCD72AB
MTTLIEICCIGEKRKKGNWFKAVLHDNFLEISKSGYFYTKKIVFNELITEIKTISKIFSEDFSINYLSENIILLTYQSYEIDEIGNLFNQALRSSIWQLSSDKKWQLRFHQGTLMTC